MFALGLSSCVGATDTGKTGASVTGRWSYVASQSSPSTASLQGALTITNQTGSGVGGSLDFVETDSRGVQRRLAGPVNGHTVDSLTLDFEQIVDGMTRRHVGSVKKDSITGTWIELPTAGGAISASGSFRAKREP